MFTHSPMLHDLTMAGIDPLVEQGLPDFPRDTLKGLSAVPKYLLPKYFYDAAGSFIFEELTAMPGYYLTGCEKEIFSENADSITEALLGNAKPFNLIELGPGSGIKTMLLLKSILGRKSGFKYIPVDISAKANEQLTLNMANAFPFLDISPFTGDYFNLPALNGSSGDYGKIILFLGSNIGNMDQDEMNRFLDGISAYTREGDKLLIGFDLKKSPEIIMRAYDDPYGLTRKFNINHLLRINSELEADFNPGNFEHHSTYDPVTGEVRSYLVSLVLQVVNVKRLKKQFEFRKWEPVFMELSRKFDLESIENIARDHGFSANHHFTDSRNYFADSLWTRI